MFDRVVIVGVGLIGSSIGMNLVKKKLACEVIGVGRDAKNLQEAVKRRAIHSFVAVGAGPRACPDLGNHDHDGPPLPNLTENDLVILATPVRSILRYLNQLTTKPLVIDVGSTKSSIETIAKKKKLRFIGTHPIAGTEKSGAAGGEIDLFQNRLCIITQEKKSADRILVEKLWKALGSRIIVMSASKHDRIFSSLSHLPHVAVYSLVKTVSSLVSVNDANQLSLGGFKGTTRVASSPVDMWHDIFLENKKEVLRGLRLFQKNLKNFEKALITNNSKTLIRFLEQAHTYRKKLT